MTVRSDSYLGLDVHEDIKLEVCEAKEAVTEHPQVRYFANSLFRQIHMAGLSFRIVFGDSGNTFFRKVEFSVIS